MNEVYVNINSVEKANKLVSILNRHQGWFDMVEGSYTVDAKSIVGIMTMDLSKPKKLVLIGENNTEVLQDISEFVV